VTDFGVPLLAEQHIAWLEENWSKATVGWFFSDREPDSPIDSTWPALYVRDGQAFFQFPGSISLGPMCCLAAREAEALDEIARALQITWEERW
jgi:hypothetical protein